MTKHLITDILVNSYNRNRYVSSAELVKLFYYLRDIYQLKNYTKTIAFADNRILYASKDVSAQYIMEAKLVILFEKSLTKYRNMISSDYTLDDKRYKKTFVNEAIIQILIHELIHASQIKYLFESSKYDTKFEVLKSSYIADFIANDFNLEYLEKYYKSSIKNYYGRNYRNFKKQVSKFDDYSALLYEIDPTEINAEYESIKEIIHINDYLNPNLNIDWKDILFLKTEALYIPRKHSVISPFERFIKKRNEIIPLDKIDIESLDCMSLPLDKRLSLGLPINKTEYKELEEFIKCSL